MTKAAPPKTSVAARTILAVKVTLAGIRPAIWRRVAMEDRMTLGDLDTAIQAAMGWHGGHLHAFAIGGRQYGDRETVEDVADEGRMTLKNLVRAGVSRFVYTYDFGDNWEHAVLIEKRRPADDGEVYPRCVAGQRACPPEDCGGPWGYEHLLAVLADPSHPDHAEQKEWFGDDLDPEAFDLETANRVLAARFGRK